MGFVILKGFFWGKGVEIVIIGENFVVESKSLPFSVIVPFIFIKSIENY